MIEVSIKKQYTNFQLNANFRDSGIIGITGKNGSGKTTLLNIIAGVIKPDEGYIKVNEKDITNLNIEERNVVLINQDSFIPTLRTKDHLIWGLKVRGMKINKEEVNEISKLLGIPNEYINKKVEQLSLGNRIRVAIATALLVKPYVLLIDEAFSNIDDKEEFMRTIFSICSENDIDLIYTTQDLEEAKLGNSSYIINRGHLSKS